MKVLFIGGTGNISTACTELAARRGVEMYVLNRGRTNAPIPEGVRQLHADIADKDAVAKALGDLSFDSVVNWIAFKVGDVERDIEIFRDRCGQYIFISSASCYQKPPTGYLMTESTPLANPFWDYSRDKIACEDRLMAALRGDGFPVTIVRPSHTYGPEMIPYCLGSKDYTLCRRILSDKKVIVPGDGTSLWVATHRDDFAKGFTPLLGNRQTIGHAFHITTDEVLTWDQIVQAIGRVLGKEPRIVHIPSEFIVAFWPDLAGNLLGDKTWSAAFDNTKIKRVARDFVATVPFAEGVRRSIEWYQADASRMAVNEEADRTMDRIIEAYESALGQAGR